MPTPILSTKLNIPPRRPDLVSRPNLMASLNSGLGGRLTLVSAPAGFGKTTLVSAWALDSERPIAWLSLDENDNDLTRFLTYLITALGQIDEGIGINTLTALQSSQSPQAEILLTTLVNEISTFGKSFTLVLDDIHLISDQAVNDALEFLLNHLPTRMHLVIIGRVDPPIPISRLRVAGQLTEIRADDLRFSQKEATDFLNDLMDLNLSLEDIKALAIRTEGWIAGLQLAALSMQGRKDKHEFVEAFSGTHTYIIDYLVEEVLSRLPDPLRSFLCRTSILERMNAPLCDAMLGISNSRQILSELNEADLFLIPLDEKMEWFRYHHLFADFLRLCLEDDQQDQIAQLHQRAASWYEENNYVNDALNHYLSAEMYPEATHLVEGHARDLLERSELSTLMKWVEKLPDKYVCSRPWLCVSHAWALRLSGARFQVVEARIMDADRTLEQQGWFTKSKKSLENSELTRKDAHRLMGHIIALRAFQALYTERIPQVIKLANQAKTFNPEEGFVRSSIGFALGWAHRFTGNLEAAHQEFSETSAISLGYGNIYMAVAATCRDAYGRVMGSQLHQAMEDFKEAEEMATSEIGRRLPVAGYAYVYMAGVFYEWNDLNSALQYAMEGIELCKQVGYILDQLVGYAYLARVKTALGDWESAQDACQQAKRLSQMMKGYVYALRWAEDCHVRTWTAQHNLAAIAHWVRECTLKIDDDLNFMRDIEHIILARALLTLAQAQPKRSHLEDALTLLAQLREMAEEAGWNGKLIEILALQALALKENGDEERAIKSIAKALMLAEPQGYVRTFIDEGQPMFELLRLAKSRKITQDYTQKLLAAYEPVQNFEQPAPTQLLIEPLTGRELQVLHLMASDLSGPEIARELYVALSTVRYHSNNIYSKLSVHNRRAAVRRAKDLRII